MDGKQVLGGEPTQTGVLVHVATSWRQTGLFNVREMAAQRLEGRGIARAASRVARQGFKLAR